MQHSFDISIAEKYGVNIAIFLNNVAFWIKKNQANHKHFYDGRYWTYNSTEALCALFPYWSTDQMDRIIKKCVSLGLLMLDNFNEKQYDRTRWYGLTDLGLELFNFPIPRNRGMDSAESRNANREIAEPIPDINTDIKPDKNKERGKKRRAPSHTVLHCDFTPTPKHNGLAFELGVSIDRELATFKDYYKANGKAMKDWDAAFNNWLRKAAQFNQTKRNETGMERAVRMCLN